MGSGTQPSSRRPGDVHEPRRPPCRPDPRPTHGCPTLRPSALLAAPHHLDADLAPGVRLGLPTALDRIGQPAQGVRQVSLAAGCALAALLDAAGDHLQTKVGRRPKSPARGRETSKALPGRRAARKARLPADEDPVRTIAASGDPRLELPARTSRSVVSGRSSRTAGARRGARCAPRS